MFMSLKQISFLRKFLLILRSLCAIKNYTTYCFGVKKGSKSVLQHNIMTFFLAWKEIYFEKVLMLTSCSDFLNCCNPFEEFDLTIVTHYTLFYLG